jgi:hypothetical protein
LAALRQSPSGSSVRPQVLAIIIAPAVYVASTDETISTQPAACSQPVPPIKNLTAANAAPTVSVARRR